MSTTTQAEGLWALIIAKYAGNCHIIRHVDHPTLLRHAELENSVIRSFALEHFPLAEALERVEEYVEKNADFPP